MLLLPFLLFYFLGSEFARLLFQAGVVAVLPPFFSYLWLDRQIEPLSGGGGGREAGRHQRIWEIEKYDFSLPLYPRPFESQNIVCDTSRRGRLGKRERTPQKEEKKDKQSHTKAFLSSLSSLPKRGGEEEEARQAEKSPSPLCSRFFQKPRKTIIIVAVVVVVAAEDSFPSFFFFFFLE